MKCRRCGSANVSVEFLQTGSRTKSRYKTKKKGCLGTIFWFCFCWPMLLFRGKKYKTKGTSNTQFTNEKMALCRDCGHSWKLK